MIPIKILNKIQYFFLLILIQFLASAGQLSADIETSIARSGDGGSTDAIGARHLGLVSYQGNLAIFSQKQINFLLRSHSKNT